MKDLGELSYRLGISVLRDDYTLKLIQKTYINQILQKYGIENANIVSTPAAKLMKSDGSKPVDPVYYQSIIGSLLYLAVATRPDISHSVGALQIQLESY